MDYSFKQTVKLKQNLKFNHNLIKSLEYISLDQSSLQQKINEALHQNPLLESHSNHYNDEYLLETYLQKPSLVEHLKQQIILAKSPYRKDILEYIILSLNSKGFLSGPIEYYLKNLRLSKKSFEFHLDFIQSLDPCGVGALDSFDSICIQLKQKGDAQVARLLNENKELILSMDYVKIQTTLHLSKEEIDTLYTKMRTCNLYPCSNYSTDVVAALIPDVSIVVENGEIIIEPINQPSLSINKNLLNLTKESKELQDYFKAAHFLIENLNNRTHTILKVMNTLVDIQKGYFLYQDELNPCTLKYISELCQLHESTISRIVNHKYFKFHNDIYPLKSLLVSQSKNGDSSDAIKKAILSIIESEDKMNPLSDNDIRHQLVDLDLICARRTITKYREQLQLPSSTKRKKKL